LRKLLSESPIGLLGVGLVLLTFLSGVLAPLITPYPSRAVLQDRLLPPLAIGTGGSRHVLGTDQLGRDILARIVYGARVSLLVGTVSVLCAGLVGLVTGLVTGYLGGTADAVVMRLVDLQLAFPFILLAMAIVTILGPSLPNIIGLFIVTSWPVYARVTRSAVLVVREQQYVEAARSAGASTWRILVRHILPNALTSLLVVASFEMARVVIVEAALGFLGVGVPPPTPTWGTMLADGRVYIRDAWWLSTFPGAAIMMLAAGVSFVGDMLRDALDPRMR
jgi:peptide/nickel transport system permease protein